MGAAGGSDQGTQIVFVDDAYSNGNVLGFPIVPFDTLGTSDLFVLAVGSGEIRAQLERRCIDAGLQPFSLFANNWMCGVDVEIGDGAVMCAFTMITASAKIGRQFQGNIYSCVAHDCVIGDYVTFAPGVKCNGNVHIDDFAYIGSGRHKAGCAWETFTNRKICHRRHGAVVTKDVPPGAVVVGNPARIKE